LATVVAAAGAVVVDVDVAGVADIGAVEAGVVVAGAEVNVAVEIGSFDTYVDVVAGVVEMTLARGCCCYC